jgi:hypothetical protein
MNFLTYFVDYFVGSADELFDYEDPLLELSGINWIAVPELAMGLVEELNFFLGFQRQEQTLHDCLSHQFIELMPKFEFQMLGRDAKFGKVNLSAPILSRGKAGHSAATIRMDGDGPPPAC